MTGMIKAYLSWLLRSLTIAIAIGVSVAGVSAMLVAYAHERPYGAALDRFFVANALVATIPFIFLAVVKIRIVRTWVTGLLVTCAIQGFFYVPDAIHYGSSGAAGLGWGFISLVLPFFVTICCVLTLLPEAATESENTVAR